MNGSTTAQGAVVLVNPAPTTPVVPAHRLRPGLRAEEVCLFGHLRWELAQFEHKDTTSTKAFLWSNFPTGLRDSFMRIAWAFINIPTPDVIHERLGSRSRSVVAASSVMTALTGFRKFARWLDKRGITQIADIDQAVLTEYAQYLGEKGWTDPHDERQLFNLTRVWAYAPFLLPADRLVMPPWDDPGAGIIDFLDDFRTEDGENKEVVIHPAIMSPLLIWAVRLVLDLAPDITSAYRKWHELQAKTRSGVRGGYGIVRDHLIHLKDTSGSLPGYIGHRGETLMNYNRADRDDSGPGVNRIFLAAQLGVTLTTVNQVFGKVPARWQALPVAEGSPLPVVVNGRIDGEAWTPAIDFSEAQALAGHLMTASMITIAYLSGMRPEEVLHLERGSSSKEELEDGTVRYRITGLHFKGVTDEDGNVRPRGEVRPEPWTVIEIVDRAVKVMEQLHDDRLLFPRSLTVRTWEPAETEISAEGLLPARFIDRTEKFITWANETAARLGRDHEIIPADPHGRINMRRLRQTVAWFIYRRPGGRIALGLQYGHVAHSMAESYGGRTTTDMLDILDFEKTLALAEALAEASDRIASGEKVSGPAADRYLAAAEEFNIRYRGNFATKGQMKSLRQNPRLQIFEDPEALLTCNLDPYKALCDIGLAGGKPSLRTPNWSAAIRPARTSPAPTATSRVSGTRLSRSTPTARILSRRIRCAGGSNCAAPARRRSSRNTRPPPARTWPTGTSHDDRTASPSRGRRAGTRRCRQRSDAGCRRHRGDRWAGLRDGHRGSIPGTPRRRG
ncbi:hypothetical protein [Streptomyces sp. LN590]|uniref:hypothetical protein n=1 Tax=Streptomyces sp. LN590 TaxID=3112980 RepID=UPI003719EAB6